MHSLSYLLQVGHAALLAAALTVEQREAEGDGPGCPSPPRPNCESRAKNSKWTVHGFDYHASYIFTTPAHQNSFGYANFNLSNTAVSYTATCSATSVQLTDFYYGNQWYPCALPSTAPAGAAVSFQFNRPTGELDITETTVCAAEKNKPETTYHAAGTTTLKLSCTDTTTTNPDWTLGSGEIYSDREVKCTPVDVTIKPSQVT